MENIINNIKNYRYIYDIKQANFYIQNGHCPIEVGICKKGIYLKFKDNENLQKTFHKWMDRKIAN